MTQLSHLHALETLNLSVMLGVHFQEMDSSFNNTRIIEDGNPVLEKQTINETNKSENQKNILNPIQDGWTCIEERKSDQEGRASCG
jgi:hypothetical protein